MANAELQHHLVNAWSVGWALYIGTVTVWIVLQRRPPLSTVLWILVLALLPYVGYIVYYFLGPQRLKRRRIKRLRSRLLIASQTERALLREHEHQIPPTVARMAALGRTACDIPLSSATDVRLLVGGAQTYDAFVEAICAAREHIHVEFYIFDPDRIGTAIRDLLAEKARQGVAVRLLVDALGSDRLGRRFLAPLREAGAQVGFFHNVRIGRRWRPVTNYRNHRKILICDGKLGFTGGLNVTDDEDERTRPDAYHDVHLRIEGGAVRWLQMVFLEDWAYATKQRTDDRELDALLPEMPPGEHHVQILTSGPDDPRQAIHRMQVAAIHAATERVWLTTAYFVPSEPALMSLTSAAQKGVDVRLLVPRRSDSLVVTAASRSYFDELLEAGVKVWEYQDRMLHSKTLLVDDTYSFIGTANFDNRSFELNFEVMALVYGETMARQLGRQFELDLRQAARVAKDRETPFPRRLFDSFARLFSPML
ncbi:cardiolipin synthase [Pigmentiphaga sp. NML080357]|uniref:cardiolipin synthase n=1 Tax=Pigmentiphaga sp. NML080357 TaxID=2008675 RepID=UPI000B408E58|nr:cardiolipin synthase [Pigmentiphaga sp. NML080357]OVZ55870.1 cardiolipin synthase [Pigmentiphaga sp. NML080357]